MEESNRRSQEVSSISLSKLHGLIKNSLSELMLRLLEISLAPGVPASLHTSPRNTTSSSASGRTVSTASSRTYGDIRLIPELLWSTSKNSFTIHTPFTPPFARGEIFSGYSLAPGVLASLRNISKKYIIVIRLWTNCFYHLLENLQRYSLNSRIALEYLQEFIHYAYTFYTAVRERENLFRLLAGLVGGSRRPGTLSHNVPHRFILRRL